MKVGTALVFQNPGKIRSDYEVYQKEIALGRLAEPLGFESLWGVEHHFTDYIMCPNVLQYLSYFAGITKNVELGSAVIVLPWHNPTRTAEEITMLDNMCGGRFLLGLGRGLGRVEFEGMGFDQNESRARFVEYSEMLLKGLETGYVEYDGRYLKRPRREIRPAPFKSFKGRTYAAAVSPESAEIMAKLGVGLLVIPQKPWAQLLPEMAQYRKSFREHTGEEAPSTMYFGWTYCHEDPDAAYEGAVKYLGGYYRSVMQHYEFIGDHMKNLKGYEYYAKMQEELHQHGADAATKEFMDLQVWGTPEQCFEKIREVSTNLHSDHFGGVFSMAGMDYEDAERNMRLFASKVMPELKKLPPVKERLKAANIAAE